MVKNWVMTYVKIKESSNALIVCLYLDDLVFIGNNPKMFGDFKQAMIKKRSLQRFMWTTYQALP
jgi:hypothetical protein